MVKDSIVIRITGDSGDGVQLVGEQLTIHAALAGHDVRTLPDFPAEIRAPAGTVAGVSGFQLALAEQTIFTAGETLDVLVALNPAALKNALQFLSPGGLLILNEDSLTPKDFEKAGLSEHDFNDLEGQYQVLKLPVISQTLNAVESLELSHSEAKKSKNFYILGLVMWLFDLDLKACQQFIHEKFKAKPDIANANEKALKAGYNHAVTLELSRQEFMLGHVERGTGDYRQITGVEAVGMAAATIATQTQTRMLVSGYPITPASAILHESAKLKDFGIELFQAEDEIAAICTCIGAAFGGALAMTCTSGPGLDLKSEALGLAVVTELPLVVIDVQRAGASTGMPTKTEQCDLRQALYGRHGEAPLPVLAPISPTDCFDTLVEAFCIATKYLTPVIVLMDAYLANAAEPWKIPNPSELTMPQIRYNRSTDPFERDENLSRSWNIPGEKEFIHQLGGLEKEGPRGKVSYDAQNHQQMVELRAKKIADINRDYTDSVIEGHVEAETLVIGWGSTYGGLKTAVKHLNQEGHQIAHLQLKHLNPLPQDLKAIFSKYKRHIVAELNTGHLRDVLRSTFLLDFELISQCNGQPFSSNFLHSTLVEKLNKTEGEAHG